MKIKELFQAILGITEYAERRKLAQKFRIEASELVGIINAYRNERSEIIKEQRIQTVCVLADNFSKTCRELVVVIGENETITKYATNIFECVSDILVGRSTIRELKETLGDPFERATDDFESFKTKAVEMIKEMEKSTQLQIGNDPFAEKLNGSLASLLEYSKPISNAIFYSKAKQIGGGK